MGKTLSRSLLERLLSSEWAEISFNARTFSPFTYSSPCETTHLPNAFPPSSEESFVIYVPQNNKSGLESHSANSVYSALSAGGILDCAAHGIPAPEITWRTDRGEVIPRSGAGPFRQVLPHNHSLWLRPFDAHSYRTDVHAAGYQCVARSQSGTVVSRTARVRAGQSGGPFLYLKDVLDDVCNVLVFYF